MFLAITACAGPSRGGIFMSGESGDQSSDDPVDSGGRGSGEDEGSAPDSGVSTDSGAPGIKLDVAAGGEQGGDGGECACVDVRDGIYLLATSRELWFYDPLTSAFELLGPLGCTLAEEATYNSMAIDRDGSAWLNVMTLNLMDLAAPIGGEVHRARVLDPADCEKTAYSPDSDFAKFGMGFATKSPNDNCDELYLYNQALFPPGTGALGRLDQQSLQLSDVGAANYGVAELTGTGEGRLFAFADGMGSAVLVEYDKETAAEISTTPLTGLSTTSNFAFAAWGGDMHFFTDGGGKSKVTRLDFDGNEGGGLTVTVAQAPALFVGAGVSTCASFTPQG